MRVLLIEEGWHSTMAIAAALEDSGHEVSVLTANGSSASCRRRTVRWTSGPVLDSPQWVPHLERVMTPGFDRVLPLTEGVMDRLWATEGPWSERLFPVTDECQRALVRDKHVLIEHMAARGIAVPRHVRVGPATDLDVAVRELGMPVVIKGATGSAGKRVQIIDERHELQPALDRAHLLGGDWILQQWIPGQTYLFGGVFDRGRPLRIYAAEKLELHPPRTGGAIRLRSIVDEALVASGLRVLAELRWTGFASCDFVRAADGRYLLLEVNPRLWGSFSGASSAGVDLFTPFAELLAGGAPAADLGFSADAECWIFPRYLNVKAHRNLSGAKQALHDMWGPQGRDWRDPAFVVHILRRLYLLSRHSRRL